MEITLTTFVNGLKTGERSLEIEAAVPQKKPADAESLLDHYSGICSHLIQMLIEDICGSLVPDGTHVGRWVRKHNLLIHAKDLRQGTSHTISIDGKPMARVKYLNGRITASIKMSRPSLMPVFNSTR